MASVEQLKKNGSELFPVTRAEAVYDEDSITLQSRVDSAIYSSDPEETTPQPWVGTTEIIDGSVTVDKLDRSTLIDLIYPVGSIYMSATLNTATKVHNALGGGWQAWGSGRVPVGVKTSETEFNSVEKTGGEKTHTLTTSEIPSHTHMIRSGFGDSGSSDAYRYEYWGGNTLGWKGGTLGTDSTGGDGSHNNLQPYITCYMYKRVS